MTSPRHIRLDAAVFGTAEVPGSSEIFAKSKLLKVRVGPLMIHVCTKRGKMLPQYELKQNVKRIIVPQFLKTLVLLAVLYFAVRLNLHLMELEMPASINFLVIIILILLLVLQLFFTFRKTSKASYKFYPDRIEFPGKKPLTVFLINITNVTLKKDVFDKMFNTGTIVLEPGMKIKGVGNFDQVYTYVQKLVESAKGLRY